MTFSTVACLGLIGLFSVISQVTAWRFNLPSILFLLIAGVLLGPVAGILKPDSLFGDLLFPMVSLAVALILFEGSLTLRFADIKEHGVSFLRLTTLGLLINLVGITTAVILLFHVSWEVALVFGAVMIVTGPTVIKPLLQAVRPQAAIANTLQWEGIILDPIGGILAVLVLGFIISSKDSGALRHAVWYFTSMMGAGIILGLIQGYIVSEIIKRHWLPNYLLNIVVLNWVLIAYIAANTMFDEMGLLVVTVMGMTIANRKNVDIEPLMEFKEAISTLLISALFIILAARADLANMEKLLPASIALFLIMQFIIQPAKVFASFAGSSLNWRQKTLISWISPRGIVAAALISLFTLQIQEEGFHGAAVLPTITFFVIVFTVVWCSITAKPLARLLKVADPHPNGVLIIGANALARAIAKALIQNDIKVIVADSNWENISTARMEGIPTYYGNPTSDVAERELNLIGIGRLMAITPQRRLNTLAGIRYAHTFGKNEIYYLQTDSELSSSSRHLVAERHKGHKLFKDEASFEHMMQALAQKAEIRSTTLSDTFTIKKYQETYKDKFIPLFVIDEKNKLSVVIDNEYKAGAADKIISLITP